MKACIGRVTDSHHLGPVRDIGGEHRDVDRILGGRVMFAHDAENDERGGKQNPKGKELPAFGFEKV